MRRLSSRNRWPAVVVLGALLVAACGSADSERPSRALTTLPQQAPVVAPSAPLSTVEVPTPEPRSEPGSEQASPAVSESVSTTSPAARVARKEPDWCSYLVSNWSVVERRGVNHRHVEHPYAETTEDEVDPFDPRCSVCEQDQVAIDPSEFGLDAAPFGICWAHETEVRQTLAAIVDSDEFDIVELTGYRPGYTRGDVVNGLRTLLSHHSFGTAIDINAGANGLYRGCDVVIVDAASLAGCVLGIGGPWDPTQRPRTTITPDGAIVAAFEEHLGWRWGGHADGPTRDLMHFSLSGH